MISKNMPRDYRLNSTAYNRGDYMIAPGPLATSAVAIFGNGSFFSAFQHAAESNDSASTVDLCQNVRIPFSSADSDDFESYVSEDWCWGMTYASDEPGEDYDYSYSINQQLAFWFQAFKKTDIAVRALGISTFYAGEALLTQSANAPDESRKVCSSDGRATQKPTMALASLIVLSLMLAIEVAALVLLGVYIWKIPAWTSTLKSLTVAQLAHSMDRGTLPPAGSADYKALEVLQRVDGRVGVAFSNDRDEESAARQLVHGGPDNLPRAGVRSRNRSTWRLY